MTSDSRCRLAVAACCLVATLGYSGAVTTLALVVYVLPTVLLVAGVGVYVRRARPAAAAAGIAALGSAQLVNALSGETSGPVARSAFLAGLGTAAAVTMANRWPPPAVFIPISLVLIGALFLGAAGEVIPVAAATVVLMALTVPLLEGVRRRNQPAAASRWLTTVVALAMGAVTYGTAQVATAHQQRAPRVFSIAQVNRGIQPLHEVPGSSGSAIPKATAQAAVPRTKPSHNSRQAAAPDRSRAVLLVIGLLVACTLALVGGRILLISWRWRKLRLQLQRGEPGQSAIGAWNWALLQLRARSVSVPRSLSPDGFAAGQQELSLSPTVLNSLRTTAALAARAAFAGASQLDAAQSHAAWTAARGTLSDHLRDMRRGRRVLARFRGVPDVATG